MSIPQRQLFKNIIYIGALSVLLDVDADVFEKLFASSKGKNGCWTPTSGLHLAGTMSKSILRPAGHSRAQGRQGG